MTVESVVTNEGSQPVQLLPGSHGGRALDLVPRLAHEGAELVFVPDNYRVSTVGRLADTPLEGCWRFVRADGEPATRTVISTSHPVEVVPNGEFAVTHEVYQDGSSSACFPEGTYDADVSVECGRPREEPHFVLHATYELTIDAEGHADLSITATVE